VDPLEALASLGVAYRTLIVMSSSNLLGWLLKMKKTLYNKLQ
jgi:hypothetical protein